MAVSWCCGEAATTCWAVQRRCRAHHRWLHPPRAANPAQWGEFRVPSLRNVARTAPYMHDGSKGTLEDVVRHYSEIPEERLHQDDEKLLRPLNLMDDEIADLVAFLKTL